MWVEQVLRHLEQLALLEAHMVAQQVAELGQRCRIRLAQELAQFAYPGMFGQRAGDQLVLEVEAMRATSRSAAVRARALVGDKVAAEAEIRFMMVDQDFE